MVEWWYLVVIFSIFVLTSLVTRVLKNAYALV